MDQIHIQYPTYITHLSMQRAEAIDPILDVIVVEKARIQSGSHSAGDCLSQHNGADIGDELAFFKRWGGAMAPAPLRLDCRPWLGWLLPICGR